MDKVSRAKRDARVLQLHIAGVSYRAIAETVDVSYVQVSRIVKRELAKAAKRRDLLGDEALAMFLERSEAMLRAQWPKAMKGDYKAAVMCDRIMARQARLFGIVDGAGNGAGADDPPEPDDAEDAEADAEGQVDELDEYRRRHGLG